MWWARIFPFWSTQCSRATFGLYEHACVWEMVSYSHMLRTLLAIRSFHKCFHIQILIIYFLMHINLRFILSLPSMEDSSSLFLWCPRLLSIYLTIRMYNAIFKSGCSILRMLNFQRSKEDATVVGILQIHQNIAWSKQILIKKKKKSGLISNFNAHLDNSFRIMW